MFRRDKAKKKRNRARAKAGRQAVGQRWHSKKGLPRRQTPTSSTATHHCRWRRSSFVGVVCRGLLARSKPQRGQGGEEGARSVGASAGVHLVAYYSAAPLCIVYERGARRFFAILCAERVPVSKSDGALPQIRRRSAHVPHPFRTRSARDPHRFARCSSQPNALGIERTRFIIVFSRVRAPQNAQSWCLGRPPSTCAHDYVLAFLASASKKTRKGRFCVKRVRTANS